MPHQSKQFKIIPPHLYQDPNLQRMAEALDRKLSDTFDFLDSVMKTRKAPQQALRQRALMKRALSDAGQYALNAYAEMDADKPK